MLKTPFGGDCLNETSIFLRKIGISHENGGFLFQPPGSDAQVPIDNVDVTIFRRNYLMNDQIVFQGRLGSQDISLSLGKAQEWFLRPVTYQLNKALYCFGHKMCIENGCRDLVVPCERHCITHCDCEDHEAVRISDRVEDQVRDIHQIIDRCSGEYMADIKRNVDELMISGENTISQLYDMSPEVMNRLFPYLFIGSLVRCSKQVNPDALRLDYGFALQRFIDATAALRLLGYITSNKAFRSLEQCIQDAFYKIAEDLVSFGLVYVLPESGTKTKGLVFASDDFYVMDCMEKVNKWGAMKSLQEPYLVYFRKLGSKSRKRDNFRLFRFYHHKTFVAEHGVRKEKAAFFNWNWPKFFRHPDPIRVEYDKQNSTLTISDKRAHTYTETIMGLLNERRIMPQIRTRSTLKIADYGCGSGALTSVFLAHLCKGQGVEKLYLSEANFNLIQKAKNLLNSLSGQRVTCQVGAEHEHWIFPSIQSIEPHSGNMFESPIPAVDIALISQVLDLYTSTKVVQQEGRCSMDNLFLKTFHALACYYDHSTWSVKTHETAKDYLSSYYQCLKLLIEGLGEYDHLERFTWSTEPLIDVDDYYSNWLYDVVNNSSIVVIVDRWYFDGTLRRFKDKYNFWMPESKTVGEVKVTMLSKMKPR